MDFTVNCGREHNSNTKKRKRAQFTDPTLPEPFIVKSNSSSGLDSCQTLKPVLILPRSQLPLSFLDTLAPLTTVSTTRLFSACINGLEADSGPDSAVLIARADSGRSFYAAERVAKSVYALCKLGGWVKEENLRQAASCSAYRFPAVSDDGEMQNDRVDWWESSRASLGLGTLAEVRYQRLKPDSSTPINLSMISRHPITKGQTSKFVNSPQSELRDYQPPSDIDSLSRAPGDADATPQALQEILDGVRVQYLDMLYISNSSLAYFPKGPLSRARAMINGTQSFLISSDHLITFLRSLILSLPLMDKKYKTSIPDFIKSLPAFDYSDDDADPFVTKPKKKRKTKKMKLGKDGLYPGEDDYVKKWWLEKDSDQSMTHSGDSNAERIRRRVAGLRTREIELQIILILEVFALQESLASREADRSLEAPDSAPSGKGDKKERSKRKSAKELDLTLVLDLLIDRLCIWQSVGNGDGEGFGSAMSDMIGSEAAQNLRKGTEAASASITSTRMDNDHLRDFCNEVILPFYGVRLPKQCTMLSQKLGGSTTSSAPPPSKSIGGFKRSNRPGDSVKRVAPSRPRQTLERVLTDEKMARTTSRGPSVPPTLSRSATAPAVPGIKREASDTSLWSIPVKEAMPPMNVCRGGVLKSKRFSKREIDMSFTRTSKDSKLQKKAEVEEKLKEAISTLKKPNRGLAIKEFVETSERRVLGGPGLKKLKKPLRTSTIPSVQVMATPKGNRKTSVFGATTVTYENRTEPSMDQVHASTIRDQYVPQSVIRSQKGPQSANEQLPVSRLGMRMMSPGPGRSIQDTPSRVRSRRGSQILDDADETGMVLKGDSSPYSLSGSRYSKAPNRLFRDSDSKLGYPPFSMAEITTPVKGSCAKDLYGSPLGVQTDCGVQETPLKAPIKDIRSPGAGAKGRQTTTSKDEGVSIYEALGWDDDDDDSLCMNG